MDQMPVIILCGGKGTRLREQTEYIPKPLVEIGGKPILWHIMKLYSHYGYNDFILALGYKGETIKQYFRDYSWRANDMSIDMSTGKTEIISNGAPLPWNIKFVDTGQETNTGGRIKKLQNLINTENFMVTYGDGLSDINIGNLVEFHKDHSKTATLTGVFPFSSFGVIKFTRENLITLFDEKPKIDTRINGGFFVFRKKVFELINDNDVLEQKPLRSLAEKKELMIYKHDGFWKCMDTYRDYLSFNEMWSKGNTPWKAWS